VEPRHSFGPFVFDAGLGLLQRDGKSITVGQRGLAILEALLDAEGGLVTKADLMERAWPGAIVEEGNLTVQIAALRKALGTAADGREWITTVPRVGYRLVHPGAASKGRGPEVSARPALAVLPFASLDGDRPGQDWFADGVADDNITALSRFRSFAVIARNSSFVYKGHTVARAWWDLHLENFEVAQKADAVGDDPAGLAFLHGGDVYAHAILLGFRCHVRGSEPEATADRIVSSAQEAASPAWAPVRPP
jgi:DNA-binding winged helix-turn-helix (wHTH) protein